MWFRRIAFFIGLNIAVVMMLSLVTSLLGIQPYLTARGLDYGSLAAFCLVWGMGGAFISLLLSKMMAKWTMGVKVIDPNTTDAQLRSLVNTVHRLATQAGIRKMPEVGIYQSPEVNAFATGATRNSSLVAVSSGLLSRMDSRSIEGILGHEVTHIANGDMVTMTLLQGVVNAFVMALARIIAFAIDNAMRGDNRRGGGLGYFGYMITVMVLQMLLFIPGSMIIAYFSRYREFRADAGGAELAGRDKMISALRNLQNLQEINMSPAIQSAPAFANMKITSSGGRSTMDLLRASHPPLEERIARLEGRQPS
jgi:heat shock protein HtpX